MWGGFYGWVIDCLVLKDDTGAASSSGSEYVAVVEKVYGHKHHFMRDVVQDEEVYMVYINTEDQRADQLTKPLVAKLFNKRSSALMSAGSKGWKQDYFNARATVNCTLW